MRDSIVGDSYVIQMNSPSNDIKPAPRRSFTETYFKTAGFGVNVGRKGQYVIVEYIHTLGAYSTKIFLATDREIIIIYFCVEGDNFQSSVSLNFIYTRRISAVVARIVRRIETASDSIATRQQR
jgi:hypothetical protein